MQHLAQGSEPILCNLTDMLSYIREDEVFTHEFCFPFFSPSFLHSVTKIMISPFFIWILIEEDPTVTRCISCNPLPIRYSLRDFLHNIAFELNGFDCCIVVANIYLAFRLSSLRFIPGLPFKVWPK